MICTDRLCFSVGDQPVIAGVNLEIPEGSCTAVVGLSGSGKSILLKLLAGILTPTEGTVRFQGQDLGTMNEVENLAFRKTMGFVFQDGALWENKSVFQNLELPLRFHHPELTATEVRERIDSELRNYKLERERNSRPAALSMGVIKMVSFLRAVLLNPKLLFLDEADTSIDPQSLKLMRGRIQTSLRSGSTVVMITGRVEWISELSTHLAIVHSRRLVAYGPTQNLVKNPPPETEGILASLSGLTGFYSDDILSIVQGTPLKTPGFK